MKQIVLRHINANRTVEIVQDMRANGLVQGVDFDFSYQNAKYNTDGWEAVDPQQTVFTFYTEEHATWFALKWL